MNAPIEVLVHYQFFDPGPTDGGVGLLQTGLINVPVGGVDWQRKAKRLTEFPGKLVLEAVIDKPMAKISAGKV
jgi:hypothetical protein